MCLIGIMEKKVETTITSYTMFRLYVGIMEKTMEVLPSNRVYIAVIIGFRVYG